MTAIDFSDADEFDRLQREPLNVEINAAVERATAATARLSRVYLGASIVGQECARQIQYDWMVHAGAAGSRAPHLRPRSCASKSLILAQLVLAGFLFAPREALEFMALDGYLAGHADGIVTSGPDLSDAHFAYPAIWECKALNAKNFRAVVRNGFTTTFPRYATQVALYQHFLERPNPALVTCVNADTCEVLHLALPFDAGRAELAIDHAQAIIDATRAGDLLPRFTGNPENFQCRICQHRRRCWKKP